MKTQNGFTLIEVVIALTIMATLTVLSSQSIQQAIKSKIKLQEQVSDMSKVRDALRVIERDINLAYHYRDLEIEMDATLKKKSGTTVPNGNFTNQPQAPQSNNGANGNADTDAFLASPENQQKYQNRKDPTTHFIGKENSLDFVTMNVGRVSASELMADFAKVGYGLEGCKTLGSDSKNDGGSSGQCLVRRLAPMVEGDVTKGGDKTVLLENVSEFKLRYFGKGKQEWNSDWSSKNNDGATKNNFPQAVEISLAVEVNRGDATKKKKISMQLVAGIRFPNNSETSASTK